jgi:hypothetical protein
VGIYSVGLGGTQGIAVSSGAHALSSEGLSINVSGEYKVHKFIGVGFETGLNFFFNKYGGYYGYYGYYGGGTNAAMEIPLIAKANFHILEATPAKIKDRLDVYAGLSFGGGPAFNLQDNGGGGKTVTGVIHVGPQVGVRYWFKDHLGVFGEFGWGATFANAGITF